VYGEKAEERPPVGDGIIGLFSHRGAMRWVREFVRWTER
jgi:hypothetical protein